MQINRIREGTMTQSDGMALGIAWDLYKYKDPDGRIAQSGKAGADELGLALYDHEHIEGNCTLNEGLQLLVDLIAGTGPGERWDNEHAYIGIGDGDAPASPEQTGLMGTNKAFAPMDETYPQRAGFVCTWRATFGPGMGTFTWNEGVITNGPDDTATCLNRKVQYRGPKLSDDTWIMSLKMEFMAKDETEGGVTNGND
jgi:hypothetical protein